MQVQTRHVWMATVARLSLATAIAALSSVAAFADGNEGGNGASCGGRRADGPYTCAAGYFCDYEPSSLCGRSDHPGTCRPQPSACTKEFRPVCGCDGKTYGNDCARRAAGVGTLKTGRC